MKKFGGKILFLDRSDINTDEIIPAKYLTEITKEALKPFLLEDLKLESFDPKKDISGKEAVITRENFGCGSSREHAPWALEVNGINVVIAESYARIFRQNMYNCGMCAIELPKADINDIFKKFIGKDAVLSLDLDNNKIKIQSDGTVCEYSFNMPGFDKELIKAGGWVEYADKNY